LSDRLKKVAPVGQVKKGIIYCRGRRGQHLSARLKRVALVGQVKKVSSVAEVK
jgi:hypothetical protein